MPTTTQRRRRKRISPFHGAVFVAWVLEVRDFSSYDQFWRQLIGWRFFFSSSSDVDKVGKRLLYLRPPPAVA
jgi:hypothetical protein